MEYRGLHLWVVYFLSYSSFVLIIRKVCLCSKLIELSGLENQEKFTSVRMIVSKKKRIHPIKRKITAKEMQSIGNETGLYVKDN